MSMALQGTQFIVTLGPAPHLDGAWQIVGKVVSGLASVREMAALPSTDDTCAPLKPISVGLCGVLGGGGLEGALQVVLEMRALQRAQQQQQASEKPADVAARVCDSVKCAAPPAPAGVSSLWICSTSALSYCSRWGHPSFRSVAVLEDRKTNSVRDRLPVSSPQVRGAGGPVRQPEAEGGRRGGFRGPGARRRRRASCEEGDVGCVAGGRG